MYQIVNKVTSDNLNSSSFIRPSQPNTSQINQKDVSSDDRKNYRYTAQELVNVSDRKSFQRKLQDIKEINILFDIHQSYRKQISQSHGQIMGYTPIKIHLYVYINSSHPKKSCFTIYFGKLNIITIPLTGKYKYLLKEVLSKAKRSSFFSHSIDKQNKLMKPLEDEAPSFTTYHLQERLNQDTCIEYLSKMQKEGLLRNYQYYKLSQKLDENFIEFYRLFCEGVMDNDYQSFKNQILHKVSNNLEIILSNVDEMDLSRPISREEQRKQNLKKSVPQIQIVKVENYFEILDQLKKFIDPSLMGEIKQHLLDQNEQVCGYFSKFLARDLGQEELSKRLIAFAKAQYDDLRPFSRCVPRSATRTRSVDQVRKSESKQILTFLDAEPIKQQDPPMFGSLSLKPVEQNFSPIKYMSDIDSNYKLAWDRLSQKSTFFAPEEYGLLYHYLQTKDDGISNIIQELEWNEQGSLKRLKVFLRERMAILMAQNFGQGEIQYLQTVRQSPSINCIYEVHNFMTQNFRYQSDISTFLTALRDEITKLRPQVERTLHKKSSDSQLLERQTSIRYGIRKYSDEQMQQQGLPSPKESESMPSLILVSLYQKASDLGLYQLEALRRPWILQFEQMIRFCDFQEKSKEEYLRNAFLEGNSSLFMQVRDYLKAKSEGRLDREQLRNHMQVKQYDQKLLVKIAPIFNQLLTALVNEGRITDKIRKWSVLKLLEVNISLISAFEVFLATSTIWSILEDESELVDTMLLIYEKQSTDMEIYRNYLNRIERILKEMSIHDQIGVEIFQLYPETIRAIAQLYYITGDVDDMLDTLQVLYVSHQNNQRLKVATLNFSGINTNPFEFDDGSDLFIRLNNTVKQIIATQLPGLKEWNSAKIDKVYQKGRMSIGFGDKIELVDGRLPNREQFEEIWMKWFNREGIKEKLKPQPTEDNIKNAITMDYLFYRAILIEVYSIESPSLIEPSLSSLDPQILYKFLQDQNNRPSCQLNTKQNMVIEYLMKSSIDVLCLQEAGSVRWEEELVKEYGMVKNHDSVIIYRKSKLGTIKKQLMEHYSKQLDFNEDSAYLFTDRHYLIISGHLKSNSTHIQQAKQMFETLRSVLQDHPLLKIIIGIDANHLIKEHEGFNLVPQVPDKPTTVKKRSYLQAQHKKAGLQVSEVKDHIITNKAFTEFRIQRIDEEESKDELLPNDIHPYDHYVVKAVIE